jgi:N-acetyl-gamma-glutamyl-phosphate reductase
VRARCAQQHDGKVRGGAADHAEWQARADDTKQFELSMLPNEVHRDAVAIARLGNLGKGFSGTAVQNLTLMSGL